MFEAAILLALLGVIFWFILAKERTSPTRRATFIDLSAELRPPAKRTASKRVSRHQEIRRN
jgi:hypothetical protein